MIHMRFAASFAAMTFFAGAAQAAILIQPLATPAAPSSTFVTSIMGTPVAGDTRLFLTRKDGYITSYDTATTNTALFHDLNDRVTSAPFDQRGLISLAFDPNYETNRNYYVFLTGPGGASGVQAQVLRFTDDGSATRGEQSIWQMNLGTVDNHIGGWLGFDQDGMLLISLGDGSVWPGVDTQNTGQNPGDFFASILRINPYADSFQDDPLQNYGIPDGNAGIDGAAPEVYLYGVRNAFRNTIAPDGNLIVADVGNADQDELTIVEAGTDLRNLGWALREGNVILSPGDVPGYHAPDLVYGHDEGAAIIGGFVYRGNAVPELAGHYVFGDQVSGNVWAIRYEGGAFIGDKVLLGNIPSLVSFGETPEGELLATQYSFGEATIYRFASDALAPVPEPASWSLMIAGFALLGGALRRRSDGQAARRVVCTIQARA